MHELSPSVIFRELSDVVQTSCDSYILVLTI